MKYIFNYLITAYYSLLNNAITVGGIVLPVYDGEAPVGASMYILLGDRTSTQLQNKTSYLSEVTLLVDVVVKGADFGFEGSENAANQIMALINSASNPNCSPNFQVVTTSILSTNSLPGINNTDNTYRTLIRYRHIVKQL